MNILRLSVFDPNPHGNGGEKRTAQISEALSLANMDYFFQQKEKTPVRFSEIVTSSIRIIRILTKYGFFRRFGSLRRALRGIKNYLVNERLLKKKFSHDRTNIIFWESTRSYNFVIPLIAKTNNVRIIAFPHNIESLVPNQVSAISGCKSPGWFPEEIKYLSLCETVYCISREDTLLLNLFGISAIYLPYYPPNSSLKELLDIRRRRSERTIYAPVKKILMLGSADNEPTRIGMVDRITYFQLYPPKDVQLIIAGYRSESLRQNIPTNCDHIRLLGTLDKNELSEVLVDVDMLLVHQQATTGALTRIIEMLLAGIPVIANFVSARNFHDVTGVFTYNDDASMCKLFKEVGNIVPPVPEKPALDIIRLLEEHI